MKGVADVRLIDPTRAELASALRKAHVAANRRVVGYGAKLDREVAFWDRFAHECLRQREGRWRSCKSGPLIPEVLAGWWTDFSRDGRSSAITLLSESG